jgi:hypothetical protein
VNYFTLGRVIFNRGFILHAVTRKEINTRFAAAVLLRREGAHGDRPRTGSWTTGPQRTARRIRFIHPWVRKLRLSRVPAPCSVP